MTSNDARLRELVALQAGEWFVANRDGSPDAADREAFANWLRTSPIHVEEYLGVAQVAADLHDAAIDLATPPDVLVEEARADAIEPVTSIGPEARPVRAVAPPTRHRWRRWMPALAAAAGVAALVVAGVSSWISNGARSMPILTCRTELGQRKVWQLPDGTQLHLDSDSLAVVRYSHAERIIELDRGRAYFEVAHEPSRRFRVIAGGVDAVAVGTQFVVYLTSAESMVITVVDGTVGLFPDAAAGTAAATSLPVNALRVGAGEQAVVRAGIVPARAGPADTREALAWLQDKITFSQRPLGEVVAEFNRYSRTPIEIDDAALRAVLISGAFDSTDSDSLLSFIETLDGVSVERAPDRIRVLRRPGTPATRDPARP